MLLTGEARDASGGDLGVDTEALMKEARRRQRRRRSRMVAAVAAVGIGAVVLFGVVSHDGSHAGVTGGAPKRVASPDTARSASAASASVYVVHVAGPKSVVVAGRDGVLATSDAGARWRSITPSTMSPVLFGHIVDIASFGTARIWLEPVGDMRMDFVPYTDDGGARWSVGVLPGGAVLSGSPMSFWTPEQGRALGERNGGAIGVYQTDDGGASWKRVAGATAGPFGGPVTFTSARAGWTWNRGGLMYRTANGGRSWQRVRLPAVRGYELAAVEQPKVFGSVVVVIARLRRADGAARTAFYESSDRGADWHEHLAPGAGKAAFAVNGSDWFALSGTALFASTNAGRAWEEATVHTPTGDAINSIDYLSPTVGWAEAAGPTIGDLYPSYLLRTTDGGRSWSTVRFPQVARPTR